MIFNTCPMNKSQIKGLISDFGEVLLLSKNDKFIKLSDDKPILKRKLNPWVLLIIIILLQYNKLICEFRDSINRISQEKKTHIF